MYNIKWVEEINKPFGHITYVPMTVSEMSVNGSIPSEDEVLTFIGRIAGECYNSSKEQEACIKRALYTIKRGHHSPWEHFNITLNCVADRGTTHAIVRHRHCAFQQSSTIYQNYAKSDGINIVAWPSHDPCTGRLYEKAPIPLTSYEMDYSSYILAMQDNFVASDARDILPNSLAANLIITASIREWVHMMFCRQGPGDAVRMHVWACLVENWFEEHYPRILNEFKEYAVVHNMYNIKLLHDTQTIC